MSIETTHNGRRIAYVENQDIWRCWDAEGIEAKTLSALKTKLDKLDADARRIDSVRAYLVDHNGFKLTEVAIVMLVKPAAPRYGSSDYVAPSEVFVSSVNRDGKAREKVALNRLIPPTPEARDAVQIWREKKAETQVARDAEKAALEAIPRLTFEALMAKEIPTNAAP